MSVASTSKTAGSARKRAPRLGSADTIREAAAGLFLSRGYQGTSIDEVAARAGVSKQTIYTHFANKDDLFQDLVLGNAGRAEAFVSEMLAGIEEAGDLEASLRELARTYVRFVIRPQVLQLRRLVIAEAARFPDLARAYYERVPARVYAAMAQLFARLSKAGRLRVDDPGAAAHHFAWLTLGQAMDQAMFGVAEADVAAGDLDRMADAAVAVFLAAYGAPTSAGRGSRRR
ncbi:MAG: TetR/AcrR family transcriptional regulator, mexJK operon transcriptional repressor [Chloroflexota bacterium]|jgi:TetR/AcrR family transcriptional repressor of mexJK operon|nr:TetR/AcrR family transcriptional regulator, mexJK operon transcriptional repressor [Chloroflexota bacterium]